MAGSSPSLTTQFDSFSSHEIPPGLAVVLSKMLPNPSRVSNISAFWGNFGHRVVYFRSLGTVFE